MSGKRKSEEGGSIETTAREKKKQKTALARTIAVQPTRSPGSSTPIQNAVAGPSKSVQFSKLPGSLDVEKFTEARAFEINAMHTAMKTARATGSQRAWQQLPRHLRRRAASHDVRRVPLRLRDKAKSEMDPMRRKALGRSLPKRGKSRQLSRTAVLLKRQLNKAWLETHIWHAKRMKMENMWGYRLAVQPTEKSFRPSHRASMHGSIIHDASYYGLLELKGSEHILSAILEMCSDPQGPSPGAKRFTTGSRACDTHFYRRGLYPYGLIAPITVLWQALPINGQITTQSSASAAPVDSKPGAPGSSKRKRKQKKGKEPEKVTSASEVKRLVWVKAHPSVFEEVFVEIKTAASFVLEAVKKAAAPTDEPSEVEIADLREHVNIFEITGPKASQVIHGSLKPVGEDARSDFKKCWNALSDLQTTASIPRNMVIGFKVHDPRLNFPPKNAKVNIDQNSLPSLSPAATSFFPTSVLAQSDIWDESVRQPLRKPQYKKKDIDERKSKNLIPGTPIQAKDKDDRIPVLLIQRSLETPSTGPNHSHSTQSNSPSLHGWTLIVPSGWAMPFFSSLIFTGTRVGGQRERQTQSFEAGCSYFPRDYPGTESYDIYSEDREFEEKSLWERKPPAKRPNYEKLGSRSPWRPDWEVVLGLQDQSTGEELLAAQREQVMDVDNPAEATAEAEEGRIQLWLLRGPGAQAALDAASSMFNHCSGLLEHMNKLREKRKMGPLTVRADKLWQSAIVRVSARMCGRGRPEDLAVIYQMDDEEARKWMKAESNRKNGLAAMHENTEDETELSTVAPAQESIIGYITTGNFSLSLGEGSAIGAIPVARLLELKEQAKRLGAGSILLVKVRDRHEIICRAARLEVLAD